jgi:hypothetical protein
MGRAAVNRAGGSFISVVRGKISRYLNEDLPTDLGECRIHYRNQPDTRHSTGNA